MAADIVFPVGLVHRKVGPGAVLTEALFFPELSRLAVNRATSAEAIRRNLANTLAKLPTDDLIRRRRASASRVEEFELVLPPPRPNQAWQDPIALQFHAVVWEHPTHQAAHAAPPVLRTPGCAGGMVLARVAELGIEVIADPKDDLLELLRRETLSTLRRLNLTISLKSLAPVQTTT